ncbi:MAG TPA: integrase, partial [bacterium]|nr:integrase [bacterium]
ADACTLEEANEFLVSFIDRFNRRFAVEAADPELAFTPAPDKDTLESIICFREQRKASKGSSISFKKTTIPVS